MTIASITRTPNNLFENGRGSVTLILFHMRHKKKKSHPSIDDH